YRQLRPTSWLAVLLSLALISFFFSSRRRHTRSKRDWSSDVCSSDLLEKTAYLTIKTARTGNVSSGRLLSQDFCFFRLLTVRHGRSEERRVGKECRARRWP